MPFDPSTAAPVEDTTAFDPESATPVAVAPPSPVRKVPAQNPYSGWGNRLDVPPGSGLEAFRPFPGVETTLRVAAEASPLAQAVHGTRFDPVVRAMNEKAIAAEASLASPGGLVMLPLGAAAPALGGGLGATLIAPAVAEGVRETGAGLLERDLAKTAGGLAQTALTTAGVAGGALPLVGEGLAAARASGLKPPPLLPLTSRVAKPLAEADIEELFLKPAAKASERELAAFDASTARPVAETAPPVPKTEPAAAEGTGTVPVRTPEPPAAAPVRAPLTPAERAEIAGEMREALGEEPTASVVPLTKATVEATVPAVKPTPKDVQATKQNWGVGGREGAIYTADYTVTDTGTERVVTVRDSAGNVIGQRDPFWPQGIPTAAKARQTRIAQVAREIVRDHEAKVAPAAETPVATPPTETKPAATPVEPPPAATTASALERSATEPLTAPPTTAPLFSPSVRASAPTGGTATGIVPPATQSFVNALGALVQPIANFGQRIRLGWRAYAQQSMPRITAAHRETGEAGTRYTAAPQVGRQLGYSFADRVLEATGVDDRKFGVAIKEDNLRGIRADFQAKAEAERAAAAANPNAAPAHLEAADLWQERADGVVSLVGAPGSPFANEAAYQSFRAEPTTRAAHELHQRLWAEQKEPLFKQANDLDPDVDLPGRGLEDGSRINLTTHRAGTGRRGFGVGGREGFVNQMATLLRRDKFQKRALGTGTSYEGSYRETMGDAFEHEYPIAAQHEFIKSLIESGNAVATKSMVERDLQLNGKPTGEARLLRLKPWTDKFLHVRRDLLREYDHAVGFGERLTIPGITPVAQFLTRQSLVGLGEGTAHSANLLMKAFTGLGPTSRPFVNALLKAVPGRPDLLATIPRVIFRGLTASRDEMLELARIGAAKEGYRGVISSTFLNPIDRGIRLVSADIYRGMAERGIVPNTETGLREFVNEVGNYNHRTQSTLVRALRSTQVQPFATGFRTAQVQALRRGMLGPGTPATSTWNAAALRMDILGGYIGFVGTVVALNKILSGSASGPPGTPLGAVGWVGDDGKTHVMDLGKLTGFTRSPVTAGALAYTESRQRGLDVGTSLKGAIRPAEASLTSQFAGPVVRSTTVALTGKSPYGRQEAPARPPTSEEMSAAEQAFRSQTAANIATALQEVNPLVNIALDRYEGKPMTESVQQQLTRWAPRTVSPVQSSEKFARIVTRANVNEYADWLSKEAKKRPAGERADWVAERMASDKVADEHRGAVMRRLRRNRTWSTQ